MTITTFDNQKFHLGQRGNFYTILARNGGEMKSGMSQQEATELLEELKCNIETPLESAA